MQHRCSEDDEDERGELRVASLVKKEQSFYHDVGLCEGSQWTTAVVSHSESDRKVLPQCTHVHKPHWVRARPDCFRC